MRPTPALLLLPLVASHALAQTFIDRSAPLSCAPGGEHAAWGDINDDGFPDLYAGNALWINRNGDSFTRVPAPGHGVLADIDNDGHADLISFAPVAIWRSIPEGDTYRFEPVTLPELPLTVSRGAAVGDFNYDQRLDVYVSGFEDWQKQVTYPSFLLLSSREGAFSVSMINADRRARGVTACDFDQDNDLDIYVSNYRLQPNTLLVNKGGGAFADEATARNVLATSEGFPGGHSIGACWGDFDNDGDFDLFSGNFAHVDSRGDQPKSCFLRNTGPVGAWKFEDFKECGVHYQESYASPACADYDNDGDLDLFFTTVYADASFGRKNHPVLYRNDTAPGGIWKFTDATAGSGLEDLPPTYQAAWADVNNDGRVDLLTAGKLFINNGPTTNHWVGVRVRSDAGMNDRDCVGAQARIKLPNGRTLTRQIEVGTGEGNSNSPIIHFGLGAFAGPVEIELRWPDGTSFPFKNAAVDQVSLFRRH